MIMSSSRKVLCLLSPRSSKVLVVRTWCRRIGTLPPSSAGKRSSHQARSLIVNPHLPAQSAALGTLEGTSSISSKALQTPLSVRHYCSTARRSLSSSDPTASSTNSNKKDGHDDDDGDEKSPPTPTPNKPEKVLLYKAPMGDLVTRLKRISITSCLVSIIGLPALIYLKNGTWPDMKQIGMGGFAFVSATGSTLALHFVFGPYVLELCEIPIRKCHTAKDGGGGGGGDEEEEQTTKKEQERAAQEYLYQATTRSILGWKREIVFDPLTDVTKYAGARPFANFIAKKEFVLYCHPELLDADTRQKLLNPKQEDEGVGGGSGQDADAKKKKEPIRRPVDEEDGFL